MTDYNKLFYYENGKLYWRKSGKEAGWYSSGGYKQVTVKGKQPMLHRVIYEMHYGTIPEGLQLDHINRVRDDNRIENLRLVTNQSNSFNQNAKGYYKIERLNKWQAYLHLNNKQINLGLHTTEEEAREAYLKAKKKYHKIDERVA